MLIPRHSFNTLPPKPEYIRKVIGVLSMTDELSERGIAHKTGLTKTQSLCALLELIKTGKVTKNEKSKRYRLIKSEEVNNGLI
jgi:hypothetical protein